MADVSIPSLPLATSINDDHVMVVDDGVTTRRAPVSLLPISSAVAAALGGHFGAGDEAHALAGAGQDGFMSAADKAKLDALSSAEQAPRLFTVQVAKTGAYTLQASDARTIIPVNSGSAVTITLNSGLPAGFSVTLVQMGAGAINLGGSATRHGAANTTGQYNVLTITPVGADTYIAKAG